MKRIYVLLLVVLTFSCEQSLPPLASPPPTPNPNAKSNNARTGLVPDPVEITPGGTAFERQPPSEIKPGTGNNADTSGGGTESETGTGTSSGSSSSSETGSGTGASSSSTTRSEKPVQLAGDLEDLDKIPLAYITFNGTSEWCSGILVSSKESNSYIVVTAAHCFWDSNKKFYEPKDVFVLNKKGGWSKAEQVFYERSNIDDAEYKDIGLIRLKNNPPVDTYDPIPIAVRSIGDTSAWETKELKPGAEVYSWGYTSRRWIKRKSIQMTGAKLWGDDAGKEMRIWVIPTKYADAFGGDSGGPLVIKMNNQWHLLGVLQGFKPEQLYTDEKTITFTWVDSFMQNIWDANGDQYSLGVAIPQEIDSKHLQSYAKP